MTASLHRRRMLQLAAGAAVATSPAAARARTSGPIDEQGFVRIGGIDQWIAIQGRDAAKPAILYLHGGPGEAQSPFLDQFRPWLTDFTVINWDQRGAGKTYGRNGGSAPDMTIERLAADAVEVAQHACRRLGVSKVILVGQSWGAELGPRVVRLKPSVFHAYVGTGQPVTWALSTEDRERWTRERATALGDVETLKLLDDTAGLPFNDSKRRMASAKWRMSASDMTYVKLATAFMGRPPFPKTGDVADWMAGFDFSIHTLGQVEYSNDVRRPGLSYPIPMFVIQGRDDHVASTAAAEAWLQQIEAPRKAYVAIDGGHWACFTSASQFLVALHACVDPILRRR